MIKSFINQWINNWYHYFPVRYLVGIETEDYHTTLFIKSKRIRTLEDAKLLEAIVQQELKTEEFNVTFITIC